MLRYIFLLIIWMTWERTYSQSDVFMTQYHQNMPSVAPGLAGAMDFLDIRTSYRQQWVGFDGAPKTLMASVNGVKKFRNNEYRHNSTRVSNLSAYEGNDVKIGIGGYIIKDELGAFNQNLVMLNTAVHVPVKNRTYLSLGLSSGVNQTEIDFEEIKVFDPGDPYYNAYLENTPSSTYLRINIGLAFYSPSYYLSYSILNAGDALLSGYKVEEGIFIRFSHQILGGYRFSLQENLELISSSIVRYSNRNPTSFDLGLKLRFNQLLDFGIVYRNDQTFIGMLGLVVNDMFRFGYSYEYKNLNVQGFKPNSHEIVLGFQLFNKKGYVPIW
ncbi:type IX secretion system membrane protein PorP/SprF [Marivirga sp. S37H4]|uniref:Type IX secretion system membrane protein PorP/SprF n=1 Tax=Marivirga aurantiaca TaxID=2802615 RepID=A0A934X2N3_9BACT|nr:type IX secretion system membrane protein PorP/SprF [Marivirga aurantiaca]MBK6267347.1 type IX secretion system membrane protein PorP/SprF [Marivirga aurantiaca]